MDSSLSLTTTELIARKERSWVAEHVLNPAYNAGIVTPGNAFANAVNLASEQVSGTKVVGKLEPAPRSAVEAKTLSAEWFAENASAGVAVVIPYVVAAKLAGFGLYRTGSALALEGRAARIIASDTTAAVAGAAMLDGFRDVHQGETRLGNVVSGATAFGIFAVANPFTKDLNGWKKIGARLSIGALASSSGLALGELVSKHRLPDIDRLSNAALSGAFMNTALVPVSRTIGNLVDRAESRIIGSTSMKNFVQEHELATAGNGQPRSQVLDLFSKELPIMKVATRSGSTRSSTIPMDQKLLDGLKSPIAEVRESARGEAARYLGDQLAAKYRQRHGISEATLTNTGIETAIRQGRLQILLPDEHGIERPVTPAAENIGNNALDVHLGVEIVRVPKEFTPADLTRLPPKELIAKWPVETIPKDGITLQPGEFLLAITQEKIVLPPGPDPRWNGNLPLLGEINSKSSIARVGLPIHQTAPVLNNGTNNRITLEIVNVNPTPLTLHPGMKIGSIVFRPLSGYPEGSQQPNHFNGQAQPNGPRPVLARTLGEPIGTPSVVPVSREGSRMRTNNRYPAFTSFDFFPGLHKSRVPGELDPEHEQK